MKKYNKLSDAQVESLAVLAEELAEAGRCAAKVLRHGYDRSGPDSAIVVNLGKLTNRGRLEEELGHVANAICLLADAGDVNLESISHYQNAKRVEIAKYLHEQESGS